jgi:hypothetical protein
VLGLTPLWHVDLISMWREGIQHGFLMSQGAVEQTISDLKERFVDWSLLHGDSENGISLYSGFLKRFQIGILFLSPI